MYSIHNNYSDNTNFEQKFTVCLKMELINLRINKNKPAKEFYTPFIKEVFKKSYPLNK